ncbi:hypothetical protein M9H77_06983 [Catharanthus roseus]|uniref:Uncharacterized protein n=1 Tax=Catharanthus roseus TaxID=4058 RepID=A0ACC0BU18_CATRO|nr:hypothetical protein M9H77_06983 [Catharanthus roseus]
MRDGGSGSGETHRWFYILHRASVEENTWRNSTSIRVGIRRAVCGFPFRGVLAKILRGSTEGRGGATALGAPLPDDLQLMAIVSGGLDHGRLCRADSDAAHLRVESSRATTELPPCCLEVEQRIIRRVEAVVSSVYAAFDKHMRWFTEQSHLSYTPTPPMMDIVKDVVDVVPSTSSSTAAAAETSDARVSSSTPPPPSAPFSSDVSDPKDL